MDELANVCLALVKNVFEAESSDTQIHAVCLETMSVLADKNIALVDKMATHSCIAAVMRSLENNGSEAYSKAI